MRARRDPDGHWPCHRPDDGFTLLESLIALSVAAIMAAGLIRFAAGTQVVAAHADRRLAVALLEASVASTLPAARDLTAYSKSGSRSGLDWSIAAVPMPETDRPAALPSSADPASPQAPAATESLWQRYRITLTISSGGDVLDRVETIRLGRASKGGAS